MTPLDTKNYKVIRTLSFLLLFFYYGLFYAQNTGSEEDAPTENVFKGTTNDKVRTRFKHPEFELEKNGLISNVLSVINNSRENLNFTVDVLIPGSWQSLMPYDKVYNVAIKDTVSIPIFIVPSKLKKNNGEVLINCFLIDLDGQQIGDNSFLLRTKRKVAWEVEVKTANRFYFKNEEFNKKFEYSVINRGNYKQDIYVSHLFPKKNLYLSDTTDVEKVLKDTDNLLSLDIGEQAEFSYFASAIVQDTRNQKKVSNTSYNPYANTVYKKYGLLINSSEPKRSGKRSYKKTNKVSFIKLPNEIELQTYGYPSMPLTVEMIAQNVLGDYPFMSLNMRGNKKFSNGDNLVYSTQLNYYRSYYEQNQLKDSPWYVGYFGNRASLEVGQVGSGIVGISTFGKGIRGSLFLADRFKVTGFYSSANGLFDETGNQSFGGSFSTSLFNRIYLKAQVGRTENKALDRNINVITLQPNIKIGKRNKLNLILAQSTQELRGLTDKVGYRFGTSFSLNLYKPVSTNISLNYNDKNFGGGSSERKGITHKTTYTISDKWSAFLNNSYNSTRIPYIQDFEKVEFLEEIFFNNLLFSRRKKDAAEMYGIFYDMRNNIDVKSINRGLMYRTSLFDYQRNFQNSITLRAGYAKALISEPTKDHFSFDFTSLTRYKVWNFTTRYRYGVPTVSRRQQVGYNSTPQFIRISGQHQYMFKNKKLILETNANYNYSNIAANNSFGFYPELFYFNKKGWRFNLRLTYSYRSTDYTDIYAFNQDTNFSVNKTGKTQTSNFLLGMGIRKEFGIPIPFAKKRSSNIEFRTFYDINGNGIKDIDETELKNVVVSLGGNEVITDTQGVAKINKTPHKKYALNLFPLEDLKGWFPNIPDSLYIGRDEIHYLPFVRGVKIQGDVVLDRQKIAVTDERPFDLSNIKITATKDQSYSTLTDINGHFEFYLPNGKYIISMDESILSNNLRLSRNNIPIVLKENQESVYLSFYILEKRRKVIIRDFSKKKKKQ